MKIVPRFQSGGGLSAFFTTYTPVATPRVASPSLTYKLSTSDSLSINVKHSKESSSKDDDDDTKGKLTEKDLFNMIKDVNGLPNEMKLIIHSLLNTMSINNLIGGNTGNIASTYLSALYKIKVAALNKTRFDEAIKDAKENGSMGEVAITLGGNLLAMGDDLKVKEISFEEYNNNKEAYAGRILTNSNLAWLRQYSGSMAFDSGMRSAFEVIENGMGFESFLKLLDTAKSKIGSTSYEEHGIGDKNALMALKSLLNMSKADRAKTLQNALEGIYSYSQHVEGNQQQIQSLINYFNTVLPKRAKVWAAMKTGISDPNKAANALITLYLGSGLESTNLVTVDFKGTRDSLLGKGKSGKEKGEGSDTDDAKLNAAAKWTIGMGTKENFTINLGNNLSRVVRANTMPITNAEGKNVGANASLQSITGGDFAGVLDLSNVSIAGSRIDASAFNMVALRDGKISSIDFPVDPNNPKMPMLSALTIEAKTKADRALRAKGINLEDLKARAKYYRVINDTYSKVGLRPAYNSDGSLNRNSWGRFGVLNASFDGRVLGKDVNKSLIQEITNDARADNLESVLQGFDKNYKVNGSFLGFGGDALYDGTVWIPVNPDVNSALSNEKMKVSEVMGIDNAQQQADAHKKLTTKKYG